MYTRTALLGAALAAALTCGGCGPATPNPDGHADLPPLIGAAERGDLSALQQLLGDADSPDPRDQCRWTPLMKAALNGHLEAVRALVTAGAALEAQDNGGYTALMLAASNDHAGIVDLLARHGADLDHAEPGLGWTALIWAAKQGHVATTAILLARGANRAIRDRDGNSAADWARRNGHADVALLLERLAASPPPRGAGATTM